jgi:hypothetical protein
MAGRTLAEVFVSVRGNTDQLGGDIEQGVRRVDTKSAGEKAGHAYGSAFGSGAKKLIAGAVAVLGSKLLVDGVKSTVAASSDLNETVSKTQQIFGKSSSEVIRFGNSSATALGQSKNAALTAAANYGNLFNNLGFTQKASAKMSTQLLRTATDLASFNNASPQEMLDGISSALAGEYDPLQRYGLAISAATVQQEALRLGLVKSTKDITPAIQAQAAYSLILKQTGKASGDFARTSGGLANQQRIAAAQAENLKAKVGDALIPAFAEAYRTLNKDFLPAITQFTDRNGPKMGQVVADVAERDGPKLAAFLTRTAQGVSGLSALLVQGRFTKNFREAFHLEEDSSTVDRLFRIREGVIGVYELVAHGRFTKEFRSAFHLEEDSATVDRILKIRDGVIGFFRALRSGDTGTLKEDIGSAAESLARLGPAIGQFIQQMPSFGNVVHVGADALGFLAEHTDTLRKYMPLLIAGVIAYKGAQAAANVASLLAVPTKVAEVLVNRQLVKSNRELIASRAGLSVATVVGTAADAASTVATEANTGAKNAGILSSIRARAAQLGQAAASVIVRGATIAWTATQWLLNAALTANPIGLVVAAIALLVAGLIIAYKKSDTFRAIVQAAFRAVSDAASFMWEKAIKPAFGAIAGAFAAVGDAGKFLWEKVLRPTFAFIIGAWLTVAGGIVNGAAKAFGWVPGLGGKLKDAAKAFNSFRDDINNALSGVHNKNVTVTAKASVLMGQGLSRADAIATTLHRASGGPIKGPGTGTSDSILAAAAGVRGVSAVRLSNDEHVWTAREVAGVGGHSAVGRMRKLAAAGKLAGFAGGGPVRFDVLARTQGVPAFRSDIAAVDRFATDVATAAATRVAKAGAARLSSAAAGATGRAPGAVGGNAALGQALAAQLYGWTGPQWSALFNLWQGESGWNNNAQNPTSTAYGIAQFLNSTWGGVGASKTSDPAGQIRAGLKYISQSYGTPTNAYGKWLSRSPHWYDGGGELMPGVTMAVNGTGRPERVRTGRQEDALLTELRALRRDLANLPIAQVPIEYIARAVRTKNTRDPNGW